MPHSIVTEKCEGLALCVEACPVNCINKATETNKRGNNYYWIEYKDCIDCGVCLHVCPVQGAVIAEERKDLQNGKGS